MKTTKFDLQPAKLLLEKHAEHSSIYPTSFKGIQLVIYPHVFNPNYTKVSSFLADNFDIKKGESCLEMFSGSGALSFIAAKKAGKVVGIDISETAITCANQNTQLLNLTHQVEFRKGNLWEAVKKEEKFDVIIANPPLLPVEPENLLEQAIADSPEMNITKNFIEGISEHLSKNGRVYMAISNACEVYVGDSMKFIEQIAQKSHLTMSVHAELNVGYEVYRILLFTHSK